MNCGTRIEHDARRAAKVIGSGISHAERSRATWQAKPDATSSTRPDSPAPTISSSKFTPDQSGRHDVGPSLFTAMQEQLRA